MIRPATIADVPALSKLAAKSFFETYFAILPELEEMLKSYVTETFSVPKVEQELREGKSKYYLLFSDAELLGYAKTTRSEPPPQLRSTPALEFERMYLDRTKVRQGLGTTFLNYLIDLAREDGYRSVWTAAYDQNQASINFQLKHGFKKIGERKFTHQWNGKTYEDNEWILELTLTPDHFSTNGV